MCVCVHACCERVCARAHACARAFARVRVNACARVHVHNDIVQLRAGVPYMKPSSAASTYKRFKVLFYQSGRGYAAFTCVCPLSWPSSMRQL